MTELTQLLRRLADIRAQVPDGELLGRFVSERDAGAFEALLGRHGPMVWAVCRRLLRDSADAEDAFQATFLVLARKGASVMPRNRVGNWLHGVAYRAAWKLRAEQARRRDHETRAALRADRAVAPRAAADLGEWLDRELSALPERYREAVVLCELEELTVREAAGRLGCPEGTVASRLSRGRALLARRLRRCGLTLASLTGAAASLAVPRKVLAAARSLPFDQAGIAERVVTLTEGVLRTMLTEKFKATAAGMVLVPALALALITGAAQFSGSQPMPPDPAEQKANAAPEVAPKTPGAFTRRFVGTWEVAEAERGGKRLSAWERRAYLVGVNAQGDFTMHRGAVAGEKELVIAEDLNEGQAELRLKRRGGETAEPIRMAYSVRKDGALVLAWRDRSPAAAPRPGADDYHRLVLARYGSATEEQAAPGGFVVDSAPDNVVASRLEGTWRVDRKRSQELPGTRGPDRPKYRLTFAADPGVTTRVPAKYRPLLGGKRIFLAGTMTSSVGDRRESQPFVLVEHDGNMLLVCFSQKDGQPMGPEYVVRVVIVEGGLSGDLLFVASVDEEDGGTADAFRRVTKKK